MLLSDWAIDLNARQAVCLTDRSRTLTSAEFALLEILAETPNQPVSRSQILDRLGSESDRYIDRNVDVLVLRLRRKIERNSICRVTSRRGAAGLCAPHRRGRAFSVISRSFLSSIAFRLPFAIVFICILVFSLSAIAIYGLQRARDEMAAYGLQAFSSLAKASLVSRQVSDLVSSAPFLMNAASPYRVSSESRSVVQQVDILLEMTGRATVIRSPAALPTSASSNSLN